MTKLTKIKTPYKGVFIFDTKGFEPASSSKSSYFMRLQPQCEMQGSDRGKRTRKGVARQKASMMPFSDVEDKRKMRVKRLSGSTIKIIAVISMFIDHVGQIILKNGIVMNAPYEAFSDSQFNLIMDTINLFHILGRIAFPIFCFLIVEGFIHTHNIKKYIIRLAIFTVVSEPIYDLSFSGNAFSFGQQNVFFTLLFGLLTITLIKKYKNNYVAVLTATAASSFISYFGRMDGWYYGIILIVIFYLFKDHNILKLILAGATMYISGLEFSFIALLDPYFLTALSSLIFILFYNGRRGLTMKYVFYIFYPAHLAALYLISTCFVVPAFF